MRILGIDPGYAIVGYGVLEYNNMHFKPVGYGAITTDAGDPFHKRLESIDRDMGYLLDKYKPDAMAVEKLFFTTNQKTAIDVAQARGVILLNAVKRDVPVFEYTPLQVKQGVVGYGKADKHQVQEMIKNILKLKAVPKPDDVADALAIAVCHGHARNSMRRFY